METNMVDKVVKLPDRDDLSPVERLAKVNAERASLFATIREEALKRIEGAIKDLAEVDAFYELVEKRNAPQHRASSQKACSTCKFLTNPPHNARAHKSQSVKAPFTADELTLRNLTRI